MCDSKWTRDKQEEEEVDSRSIFWRAANASSLSTNQTKTRSPISSSPIDEILSQQCDDIDEPSTQLMDVPNKREGVKETRPWHRSQIPFLYIIAAAAARAEKGAVH